MGCVYKVVNKINNKIYIGKTIRSLHSRKSQHIRDSKNKNCKRFQRAIAIHGEEAFQWEEIYHNDDNDTLLEIERMEILRHKSNKQEFGYNIHPGKTFLNVGDFIEKLKLETILLKNILPKIKSKIDRDSLIIKTFDKWEIKDFWLWQSAYINGHKSLISNAKAIEKLKNVDRQAPAKFYWCPQ